jgi:hypothetical protein
MPEQFLRSIGPAARERSTAELPVGPPFNPCLRAANVRRLYRLLTRAALIGAPTVREGLPSLRACRQLPRLSVLMSTAAVNELVSASPTATHNTVR